MFQVGVVLASLLVNEVAVRDGSSASLPWHANGLDPGEVVTDLAGAFHGDEAGFTLQGVDLHSRALKPQPIAIDQRFGVAPANQLLDLGHGLRSRNAWVPGRSIERRQNSEYPHLAATPRSLFAGPKDFAEHVRSLLAVLRKQMGRRGYHAGGGQGIRKQRYQRERDRARIDRHSLVRGCRACYTAQP